MCVRARTAFLGLQSSGKGQDRSQRRSTSSIRLTHRVTFLFLSFNNDFSHLNNLMIFYTNLFTHVIVALKECLTLMLMFLDWSCLFLAPVSCNGEIIICHQGSLGKNTENWRNERRKLTVSASPTQCWSWSEQVQSKYSGIHLFFSLFFRVPIVIWEVKSSGAGRDDPHWREHHLPPGTMQQSEDE